MKIKEMETEKLISLLCGDQFMNTKALPEYDIPSLLLALIEVNRRPVCRRE